MFDMGAIEPGRPYIEDEPPKRCEWCDSGIYEYYITEDGEEICEDCFDDYLEQVKKRAYREVWD